VNATVPVLGTGELVVQLTVFAPSGCPAAAVTSTPVRPNPPAGVAVQDSGSAIAALELEVLVGKVLFDTSDVVVPVMDAVVVGCCGCLVVPHAVTVGIAANMMMAKAFVGEVMSAVYHLPQPGPTARHGFADLGLERRSPVQAIRRP